MLPSMAIDGELMAKLECNTSFLKDSDYRLKSLSFNLMCTECDLGIRKNVNHLVMQCPTLQGTMEDIVDVLQVIDDHYAFKSS